MEDLGWTDDELCVLSVNEHEVHCDYSEVQPKCLIMYTGQRCLYQMKKVFLISYVRAMGL